MPSLSAVQQGRPRRDRATGRGDGTADGAGGGRRPQPAQLEAGVAGAVAELGDIDIVVANAGVVAIGNREPHAEDVYNAIVETNLNGCGTLLATVPSMIRKGRGGSIVLVSSSQPDGPRR